jgi:hypothetical protein
MKLLSRGTEVRAKVFRTACDVVKKNQYSISLRMKLTFKNLMAFTGISTSLH